MKSDNQNTENKSTKAPKNRPFWILILCIIASFIGGYLLHSPKAVEESEHSSHEHSESEKIWTCSMHPQIRMKEKGQCPICGMDLIPAATGDDNSGPWELALSEKAQKLASIQVAAVERRYVAHEVRVVGSVAPNEQRISNITARFPGRIDRLFVDFVGTGVRKGDHLVSIYSPELLSAQKELLEAVKSQKNGLSSLRKAAAVRVAASREKLRLWNLTSSQIKDIERRGETVDHVTIYAPMKGVVLSKHAVEGDYIKTGSPIYTISDLSKVWVKLDIYETDLKWVRLGQEVDFSVQAYPGETFTGKIVFIDPVLNKKTRTIRVRINVENMDMRLKPDMFVRAIIYAKLGQSGGLFVPELIGKYMCPMHPEEVSDKKGICGICGMALESTDSLGYITKESTLTDAPLVIPASAALITGTRAVVYVAVPGKPGTFQGRQIVLGPRAGDTYSVVSGLSEGDNVVTHGAFKIDSELQIQAKSSMMYASEEQEPADHMHPFKPNQSFIDDTRQMVDSFYNITVSLSEDQLGEMQASAKQTAHHLRQVEKKDLSAKELFFWEKSEKEVFQLLDEMNRTEDIETARTMFSSLDQKMHNLIQKFNLLNDDLVVRFHCPMAFDNQGAFWLQKGAEPANPYFGSQMLTCFDTKEVISGSEKAPSTSVEEQGAQGPAKLALPGAYTEALSRLFSLYFEIQSALADDNLNEAKTRFVKSSAIFNNLDMSSLSHDAHSAWMAWEGQLKSLLKGTEDIDNIEHLRKKFEPFSSVLYEAATLFKISDSDTLFRFHCPMAFDFKGADWLQNHDTLKNPYFGKSMLSCGSLTETLTGEGHDQ